MRASGRIGLAIALGLGVTAIAIAVDVAAQRDPVEPTAAAATPPPAGDADATVLARSNIRREDYVGPEACAECHAEQYDAWRGHPHRLMNADADADTVVGDFSGVKAEYGGVTTVFARDGDEFSMSHYRDGVLLRRDRVTRTIGSRFQQAYVGVQTEGPEPADHPIYSTERALPWVYWFSRARWYPEHFVEQYPEPELDADGELRYPIDDPYSRGTRPWSEGCMLCHNTYAFELRFRRDMPGTGFPELKLHPAARAALAKGPAPDDLVTLGVSCESCHFGGRDHAERELELDAVPTSPHLAAARPPPPEGGRALDDAHTVVSICAQCHVAGTLPHENAASSLNSSEALDMRSGDCASEISCTDCHDPHRAGRPGGEPDDPAHLAACTGCHAAFAEETARAAHARHDAADASCLDCHMPRITQGVDTVVRSHRIGSPTHAGMLGAGSLNACNLCHLDRSIAWTVAELRRGWGARVDTPDDRGAWSEVYGPELGRPVGEAWLDHPTPIVRLVATDAYARSGDPTDAVPRLLPRLLDEYPHTRMFTLMALERVTGRRIDDDRYTPTASADVRAAQVEALGRWLRTR